MVAQPPWTGWVVGELRFGSRALDRWHEAVLGRGVPELPAWIAPGPAAVGSVATELAAIEAFARAREQSPTPSAEYVSLTFGSDRVRFAAHLGPLAFAFWGGQLAALACSADQVGAQGEVAFVERPARRGHCVRLDGKGQARVGPFDEAAHQRWRDELERMTTTIPPEGTYRARHLPLTSTHRSLGGVFEGDAPWGLPDRYAGGPEHELGLLRDRFGVIDISPWAAARVAGRGTRALLKQAGSRALARLWRHRAAWGAFDADGGAFGSVLGVRDTEGTVLFGAPGMALHLEGWLARRATPRGPGVRDVTEGSSGLAFVGPEAAAVFEGFEDREVVRLAPGRVTRPADGVLGDTAVVRVPLHGLDGWIVLARPDALVALMQRHAEHLCGARAWQMLQAGSDTAFGPVRRPLRADGSADPVVTGP